MSNPPTPADEHSMNMSFLRRRLTNISDLLSAEYRVRSYTPNAMLKGLVYAEVSGVWGLYWATPGMPDDHGTSKGQLVSIAKLTDDHLLESCINLFLVVKDLKEKQKEFSARYLAAKKHLDNFAESLVES